MSDEHQMSLIFGCQVLFLLNIHICSSLYSTFFHQKYQNTFFEIFSIKVKYNLHCEKNGTIRIGQPLRIFQTRLQIFVDDQNFVNNCRSHHTLFYTLFDELQYCWQ
jgi:hypothetical protein